VTGPYSTDIHVFPIETLTGVSYLYRIGDRYSEHRYANTQSALADARRPQRLTASDHIEPVPHGHTHTRDTLKPKENH
jgi:hypothetical protein